MIFSSVCSIGLVWCLVNVCIFALSLCTSLTVLESLRSTIAKRVLGLQQKCVTGSNRMKSYETCVFHMVTKYGFDKLVYSFYKSV